MIRLGIDVGNSGCKIAAFDESGALVSIAHRPYTFHSPRPGWREFDAEHVFQCVLESLAEVCANGVGARVEAVAVSSQGEAIIPLDSAGLPLAPAQASFDTRSAAALEQVYDTLDGARLEGITGNPRHAMFSLYKLLTIRDQQPELYERIHRIAAFADWIAHRLGSELMMDYSLASRTSMLDIRTAEWSPWVLQQLGLSADILPPTAPSGTLIGTVSAAIVQRTGISARAKIATGGHDQICCALGAGITTSGQAMNSMGTTDSIVCLTPSLDGVQALAAGGNAVGISAVGEYAMHAFVMSTGSATAWFARTFAIEGASLDEMAGMAWNGGAPSGISFLPHLVGSGTPHLDALSTGSLLGLTTESTPALIYRAILEGIAFELQENLEHMNTAGADITSLTVIGGASASAQYLQIKADIFGVPVQRAAVAEAGCFGAALLAGKATGEFPDITEAARDAVKIAAVFEPDSDRHDAYQHLAATHAQMYPLSSALVPAS